MALRWVNQKPLCCFPPMTPLLLKPFENVNEVTKAFYGDKEIDVYVVNTTVNNRISEAWISVEGHEVIRERRDNLIYQRQPAKIILYLKFLWQKTSLILKK